MSSSVPLQQEKQAQYSSTINALVKSVLERDILLVLYHLKGLGSSAGDSVNQQDPSTRLTPLEAALSLFPADCPRRSLIHQILLLSGAVESQNASNSGRASDLPCPRDPRAARMQQEKERAIAHKLLKELTIEQAEGWLYENELGVEDTCDAQETSSRLASPSPSEEGEIENPKARDLTKIDQQQHRHPGTAPPSPPASVGASATPEPQPSPFYAELKTPPRPSARVLPSLHFNSENLPPAEMTATKFLVEHLGPRTTSVELKSLLTRSLDHTLIDRIECLYVEGKPVLRVTLRKAVAINVLKSFDGAELDGGRIGVSFKGACLRGTPRVVFSPYTGYGAPLLSVQLSWSQSLSIPSPSILLANSVDEESQFPSFASSFP